MDPLTNKSFTTESEGVPTTPEIIKMSPITNLALNLSGLTTSVAGTPMRRISWSNPIPGGEKIGLNLEDLSPSNTDSPTIQYLFKCGRSKVEQPATRIIHPPNSDDDKENITPRITRGSVLVRKTQPLPIMCDRPYRTEHLDSGYSSLSVTNTISVESFEYCSSILKQRSSVFENDEENSMENIFHLEEADDQEILIVPDGMSGLLTKPLQSSSKPLASGPRRGKLPIRRCLSMEVEFDPDVGPSTSKALSKHSTIPSSSVSFDDSDVDVNENCNFKRPDPPGDLFGMQSKRRRSSPSIDSGFESPRSNFKLHRSYSETAATIMHAILKSDMQPELIGDGSRMCKLPLVKGKHDDLKSISPDTLAQLLNSELMDVGSFIIVDCRYPYEFEGGHIQGAKNIFTKEAIMEVFFTDAMYPPRKNIIIFHCEFSSERAPTLCRFLRNKDRELNEGNYPQLFYPEMYILEGGYKAFFNSFKELCEPQMYKPMNHKDHGFELRHFRAKSKSWGADSKGRCQLRSYSKTSVI